ncbi:Tfp pilus assembly protein PilO [Thioflavicoccus mobilis 8321]|uniref:Tfp pilus assembly protein PilO n=1 Tax=Thioflavicoccus mobilis 8321 TaxID=765912 RepID=L0GUB9_9GAMM|nr:type 4a pilus biogenesis protein PilO [Thioflavicoccus mobilis]AGA88960.1 Tfp pilus assembly protein PilO [Thioflavicoccus mobilis 8321]
MDLNVDLNDLDLNTYGEWPALIKGIVVVLIVVAVGFGWYHFHAQGQVQRLEQERKREVKLKTSFEEKQRKAANLDAYRQQLAEMEESFGAMLRQLPDETEVAALLVDVSQTGLAAGLVFELFEPRGETTRDFYAELPIRIRVIGFYHDFGRFISGLAALPRIVTIHDVTIKPVGSGVGGEPRLALDATLKTYRYLEEGPER